MTATPEELLRPTHALLLLLEYGARERFAAKVLGRGSLDEMSAAKDAIDTCAVDDPAITGAAIAVVTMAELESLLENASCQ